MSMRLKNFKMFKNRYCISPIFSLIKTSRDYTSLSIFIYIKRSVFLNSFTYALETSTLKTETRTEQNVLQIAQSETNCNKTNGRSEKISAYAIWFERLNVLFDC